MVKKLLSPKGLSGNASFPLSPRLRLAAAAAYLGVSPRSLADRGWRRKHGIPCFKIGAAVIFDGASLDRWLARHAERPISPAIKDLDGGER